MQMKEDIAEVPDAFGSNHHLTARYPYVGIDAVRNAVMPGSFVVTRAISRCYPHPHNVPSWFFWHVFAHGNPERRSHCLRRLGVTGRPLDL